MATPYLSEIKIMSFGFPPKGWALLQWATDADQSEPGFVLAAGHHLRRRWSSEFRPSQPVSTSKSPTAPRPMSRRPRTGLGGGECGVFNAAPLPELCRNPGRVETPLCALAILPAARAGRTTRNRSMLDQVVRRTLLEYKKHPPALAPLGEPPQPGDTATASRNRCSGKRATRPTAPRRPWLPVALRSPALRNRPLSLRIATYRRAPRRLRPVPLACGGTSAS